MRRHRGAHQGHPDGAGRRDPEREGGDHDRGRQGRVPGRRVTRPTSSRTLVGVYGTLKRGHANHDAFLRGAEFVEAGAVRIPYRLFGNEEYPMLVPAREVNPVVVETYRVDAETVSQLDAFEGQFGYRRVEVVPEGATAPVAIYVHPGPPPPSFVPAPGGRWNGEPAAFARALARARNRDR
ncbi:MAG: gamma-glutamylcyclotransferase [Acidobacteria bacterium]|nr:gamma-glutamylcyclotransferase [Acidobacteriota bacterium]